MCGDISFCNNCIITVSQLCESIARRHKFQFNLTPFFPALSIPVFSIRLPKSVHSSFPRCSSNHGLPAPPNLSGPGDSGTGIRLYTGPVISDWHGVETTITVSLYYDCTNFFFEIEQEDGFRQYGPSKEHRPNLIVEMGLFLDGDGIPLAFCIHIAGIPMNRLHCNRWKKKSCVIFLSPSSLFVPTVDCRLYLTVSSTRKVEGRS